MNSNLFLLKKNPYTYYAAFNNPNINFKLDISYRRPLNQKQNK